MSLLNGIFNLLCGFFFSAKSIRQITIEGSYGVPYELDKKQLSRLVAKNLEGLSSRSQMVVKSYNEVTEEDFIVGLEDFIVFFQEQTGSFLLEQFRGKRFVCISEPTIMNNAAPGCGAHKEECYLGITYLHDGGTPNMHKHNILFIPHKWIFGTKKTVWSTDEIFVIVFE